MGVESFQTCRVTHLRDSCAVSLKFRFKNNGKDDLFHLTYSGDAIPTNDIVKLGKNSTLLIHEATFQDELETIAKSKKHSTISQALEQSRKMNAKYTILTHFSLRYSKIPFHKDDLPENTGIAFDNMQVTLDDLPNLSSHLPKYREIFPAAVEELDTKTNLYIQSNNRRTINCC